MSLAEVAINQTKAFCPIPGCEGICDGIPGVAQPVNCFEVWVGAKNVVLLINNSSRRACEQLTA